MIRFTAKARYGGHGYTIEITSADMQLGYGPRHVVICWLRRGDRTTVTGLAIQNPTDTEDDMIGARLALRRAMLAMGAALRPDPFELWEYSKMSHAFRQALWGETK